eukprot:TRINITY_DN13908_c0_g1_i1.p1 TRINITY_DN13908_c0_g1~~TRINITY_DN13908_c0_g1_i1.p1  ORF type:complete len:542 (+),score=169.48 TRINITY_DN13908_c0_g1_i1:51-1628(+)
MPTPLPAAATPPPQEPTALQWRDTSRDLNLFLQEIVGAVQRAQAEIADLRCQVGALAGDVHGDRGIRQRVLQTDAGLTSVCEVLRVERRKREAVAVAVQQPRSFRALVGRYYARLLRWSQSRQSGQRMGRTSSLELLRSRWQVLLRWHRLRVTRRRQRDAAERLYRCSLFAHLRGRLREWVGTQQAARAARLARAGARHEAARDMAIQSARVLLSRALSRWRRLRSHRDRWLQLTRSCRGMCEGVLLALVGKCWQRLGKLRHRRYLTRQIAAAAAEQTKAVYWRKWQKAAALYRAVLRRRSASGSLLARTSKALALRYYSRWSVCATQRREHRHFASLSQRVDVGLQTLQNTNSVLNRLVDRFIAFDEQLDALDKDKVGRRELSGLAGDRKNELASRASADTVRALSSARELLGASSALGSRCDALMERERELALGRADLPPPDAILSELSRLDARVRDDPRPAPRQHSSSFPAEHGIHTPDPLSSVPRASSASSAASHTDTGALRRQQEAQWVTHFADMQRSAR